MSHQALSRYWPGALCALLLCLLAGSVAAEDGYVRIVDGEVGLREGVWELDARIDYRLSDAAREALENGVALEMRLDIKVVRPAWIWWETTVAELTQRYRIQYHALSERYVLVWVNSGESRSFRSLSALRQALGRVEGLPVIDAGLLGAGTRYTVAARAGLDTEALPRPLRSMAYLSPQWQLESEWKRWRLHDDA
ncbi:DUF4390 domain-containing protein [Arhodomonas sp. SL1]|uniref:DUF4390 domain-containing protein n=1 Tax=Arhodomonas sp. SL1 TaxID=3425691 RepID=UPI003F880AA0